MDQELTKAQDRFLIQVDAKVDEIGDRVSKIEGKIDHQSQGGFRKSLSDYGGTAALFLSIIIGIFTLYDKLVIQPEKNTVEQETNFRNSVNELANIGIAIGGLDWTNNPETAEFQSQAYSSQRLALLGKIKIFESAMPDLLNYADRLLLVNEYRFFGWIQEALEQAEFALKSAIDPYQTANAHWTKATIYNDLNEPIEMRVNFSDAISEYKSLGLNHTAKMVMQIYIQWIAFELTNDTCDAAHDVFSLMIKDYSLPKVWPDIKENTKSEFAKMLSQFPKSCGLALN